MAKANLDALVERINETSAKSIREGKLNSLSHVVRIDEAELAQQLLAEIQATDPDLIPLLKPNSLSNSARIIAQALKLVLAQFVEGDTIKIPRGSNGYRKISQALTFANSKAVYYLKKSLALESTKLDPKSLIQFDHDRAVGDVRSIYLLSRVKGGTSLLSLLKDKTYITDSSYDIFSEVVSYYTSSGAKGFELTAKVVEGSLRSGAENQQEGRTKVLARRGEILRGLRKLAKDTDWINQKGSDSKLEQVRKTLINTAIKRAAKGKLLTIDTKASKSTSNKKVKISEKVTSEPITNFLANKTTRTRRSDTNYLSTVKLIALINAALPAAVRANMIGGRLHNQTGRFASSVSISSIDQTPQGYPRLNYTYQPSPYDVFDPQLGKSPWNTPARDPKTLIDKSIRDVARELAIGRFYTRRA